MMQDTDDEKSADQSWSKAISRYAVQLLLFVCLVLLTPPIFSRYRRILHTMHASDRIQTPQRYWVFDHMITGKYEDSGASSAHQVAGNLCLQSDRRNCSASAWQRQVSCPQQSADVQSWVDLMENLLDTETLPSSGEVNMDTLKGNVTGQFIQMKPKEGAMVMHDSNTILSWGSFNGWKFKYALPIMFDACKLSRIPDVFLHDNDSSVYSIAGAHDSTLLLLLAVLCVSVVAWERSLKRKETERSQYDKAGGFAIWILAILFFLIDVLMPVLEITALNKATTTYAVISARGSWFYGLIVLTFLVIYVNYTKIDDKSEKLRQSASTSNASKVPVTVKNELNLSGFMKPKHSTAGNFDLAPNTYKGLIDVDKIQEISDETCGSWWSVVQISSLPLLLLSVLTYGRSFELDSDVVTVFVVSVLYCSLDVILERVEVVAQVVMYAMDNSNNSIGHYLNIGALMTLLTSVLQLSCVIVILDTIPWFPYDHHHILADNGDFDGHFKIVRWTALVFFLTYYIVISVLKILKSLYPIAKTVTPMNYNLAMLRTYLFFFVCYALFTSIVTINEYTSYRKGNEWDFSQTSTDAYFQDIFTLVRQSNDNNPDLMFRWRTNLQALHQ